MGNSPLPLADGPSGDAHPLRQLRLGEALLLAQLRDEAADTGTVHSAAPFLPSGIPESGKKVNRPQVENPGKPRKSWGSQGARPKVKQDRRGVSCPFGAIHLLYGGKNSSHGAKCRSPGSAGARHPSGVPSPSPRRSRGGAVSGKGRSRFPESSQSASVKPVRPNGADRFRARSDCSFIRFGGFAAKARKFLV